MGCTSSVTLAGITYDCTDVPYGGIKSLYISRKDDTVLTMSDTDTISDLTFTATDDLVQLEFNNKDGFSNFTDVKTVDAAGSVTVVPTISVEFPKMTKAKRDELNAIANAGLELIAWVETAAGTYHCVGSEYGLYAQTINGQSGASRSDKSVYQLTLTGEENSLSLDAAAVWSLVLTPVATP